MLLPSWLKPHLPTATPSPHTVETFADEVARLMGLPPALRINGSELSSETDHVWLLWKSDVGGAILMLDRPCEKGREGLVIKMSWYHSPNPADIAAMVRVYQRRGRVRSLRSRLGRALRRN